MRNLILRQGDMVRYFVHNPDLGRHWFGINTVHEIKLSKSGCLYVQSSIGVMVDLVDALGQLTEYADNFTLVSSEVKLPKGSVTL